MRGTRGWKRGSQLFTLRLPSTLPLVSVDVCTILAPTRVFNDRGSIVDPSQLPFPTSAYKLFDHCCSKDGCYDAISCSWRISTGISRRNIISWNFSLSNFFLFHTYAFLRFFRYFYILYLKLCATFNFKNFAWFEILLIYFYV